MTRGTVRFVEDVVGDHTAQNDAIKNVHEAACRWSDKHPASIEVARTLTVYMTIALAPGSRVEPTGPVTLGVEYEIPHEA